MIVKNMTTDATRKNSRALPEWKTGKPLKPGLYVAFSTRPERTDGASLYYWDGKTWQHCSGFYDHAVDHWMELDQINIPE